MLALCARIAVIAALALAPGLAAARGGGHGGGGAAGGGHGMGGHAGHDGADRDRDEALGQRDAAANSGPCGMGWGWHEPAYCEEPSKEAQTKPRPEQRAAVPSQE
jgi:hypothetical protein